MSVEGKQRSFPAHMQTGKTDPAAGGQQATGKARTMTRMAEDSLTAMPPTPNASRGRQSIGDVTGATRLGHALQIECGEAAVRVIPLACGAVRVRLAPAGAFDNDDNGDPSWAVVPNVEYDESWQWCEGDDRIDVTAAALLIRIRKRPCRISFHTLDGVFVSGDDPACGLEWGDADVRCWKALNDADHFFGLGEKGPPLDKRSRAWFNWNVDAAEYEAWTDPLYQTHPFLLCLNAGQAYGIFLDNTYRSSFDLGVSSRTAYSFGADGGEMNYYFLPGPTPAEVVCRYAALVGTTPLPPRWTLGYQQCRWSYESARRVRLIAEQFRRRKIPCDTIYIDIDYMDDFRCFTWHPKRFTNPRRLFKVLAQQGFKAVTIVDPGIKHEPGYAVYDDGVAGDHFCRGPDGDPYVGKVWPGPTVYPDFTRERTRRWWGNLYRDMLETGVAGFWNDMNEPADFTNESMTVPLTLRHDMDGRPSDHRAAHNIYGMQMARATFEGLRRLRPEERPFVLTRAGYSGVQRYAAVWTGDNKSSWDHLRMSIPMLLNMGLSGVTFCGADIGGFRETPSPELFTRWLQLGIFYPLCRVHTAGGPQQEPWSFGKTHERINRDAIALRYRLLPYLYTEMQHAAATGLPVMRPLMLDFPTHPRVHRCEYDFLFGRQLLIAPVVEEGARRRKLTLPTGDWYRFDDGSHYTGGLELDLPVTLASIPMFARSGAVIALRDVQQYTDERPLRDLTLHVYPGDGGGTFYNDDGQSYEYRQGAFILEHYETQTTGGVRGFRLRRRSGDERFLPVAYVLEFKGVSRRPAGVMVGGEKMPECRGRPAFRKTDAGWRYDSKERTVRVRLARLSEGEPVEVVVRRPKRPGR